MLSNSIAYMQRELPSHGLSPHPGKAQPDVVRGISSAVERTVHIGEVAGSNPASPTTFLPLSRGLYAAIDREDAWRVAAYSWSANAVSPGRYYAQTKVKGRNLYLHRFIINAPSNQIVDHVNGDALDCRKANLRLASASQSSVNVARRPGKTGYRGVHERMGRFQARVKFQGQTALSGYYHTTEEAARAYDAIAIQLHGEFAVLNFPGMPNETRRKSTNIDGT